MLLDCCREHVGLFPLQEDPSRRSRLPAVEWMGVPGWKWCSTGLPVWILARPR